MCSRISEFASSYEASLVRAQAIGDERFGASIEVESYLFVDLAVEFRATEDGSEPISKAVQHWAARQKVMEVKANVIPLL